MVSVRTHDERGAMNLDHYKALLLTQDRELVARRARTGSEQQEPGDGAAGDVGDDSVDDEQKAKLFTEDEANASVLDDVRLALGRIADGSYGRCLEDDEPIDEKRLEAVPWAKYCARHQAEREEAQGLQTPSL
jgi:DnaK suppressor protein